MSKIYTISVTDPKTDKTYSNTTTRNPDEMSDSEKIMIAIGAGSLGLDVYNSAGDVIEELITSVSGG